MTAITQLVTTSPYFRALALAGANIESTHKFLMHFHKRLSKTELTVEVAHKDPTLTIDVIADRAPELEIMARFAGLLSETHMPRELIPSDEVLAAFRAIHDAHQAGFPPDGITETTPRTAKRYRSTLPRIVTDELGIGETELVEGEHEG